MQIISKIDVILQIRDISVLLKFNLYILRVILMKGMRIRIRHHLAI